MAASSGWRSGAGAWHCAQAFQGLSVTFAGRLASDPLPEGAGCGPQSPWSRRGLPLGGQPVLGGPGRGQALLPTPEPGHRLTLSNPADSRHIFLKEVGKASSFKTLIKKLFSSGTFQGPSKEGRKVFILTHEGNGL